VVVKKFTFAISSPDEFLLNYGDQHIFGMGEVRHLKFGLQIDIPKYYWRHDRQTPKAMCSDHITYLIFGEITDNISVTVQDTYIFIMED